MKHLVVRNAQLHGLEFGMLRDFEDEVVNATGAAVVSVPQTRWTMLAQSRFTNGGRYRCFRRALPRESLSLDADVVWIILMCPENFSLDLFSHWQKASTKFILYLFDTFEEHFSAIQKLTSRYRFDLLVTSFAEACPRLENLTGKVWHVVPQGVSEGRFSPVPFDERVISFSSYGRRDQRVHKVLYDFCRENGLYYDFNLSTGLAQDIDVQHAYARYAWHLSHSNFNVCLPTEYTHPQKVAGMHPITCRWFETMASATPILGRLPGDISTYRDTLGTDLHCEVPLEGTDREIFDRISMVWHNRQKYLKLSEQARRELSPRWTWGSRIRDILSRL